MPEAWSTTLTSARLVKEVSDVGSRSVTYYWLDLTFKIDLPEGVEPGVYDERVTLRAKQGEEKVVPMNFIPVTY